MSYGLKGNKTFKINGGPGGGGGETDFSAYGGLPYASYLIGDNIVEGTTSKCTVLLSLLGGPSIIMF